MRLAVLLGLILTVAGAYSQPGASTGAVHGAVTDPAQMSTPAAAVILIDPRTGITRSVSTDESGEFRFALLPPARYDLRVRKPGFRTASVSPIDVVGAITTVNVELHPGDLRETIEVTGAAPVVERERVHQANTIPPAVRLGSPHRSP
jgi:hypothetical protein